MVATRDRNLWQGNLKEQLGVLLLRSLAAVAPVPIQEDFGIDAVCTLFRREGSRTLFAEDTFFVQIKSASVQAIEYENEKLDWLFRLELPFFIARVESDSITLFPMHSLSNIYTQRTDIRRMRFVFDEPANSPEDWVTFILNEPAAKWTLSDSSDEQRMREMYAVLKSHIVLDRSNILLRQTGRLNRIVWERNKPARQHGIRMAANAQEPKRMEAVLNLLSPYVAAWIYGLFAAKEYELGRQVILVLEKMVDFGFPKDVLSEIGVMNLMSEIQEQFSDSKGRQDP